MGGRDWGEDDDDDDHETNRPSPELTRLQAEAASIVDHAVQVDTPRRTRADDKDGSGPLRSSSTKTVVPQKRGGTTIDKGRGPSNKRQKYQTTIPVSHTVQDDSDDSDDLKFRFTRRVKG